MAQTTASSASAGQRAPGSRPSGTAAALRAVDRAIAELRRGEPVLLTGAQAVPLLLLPVEAADGDGLARLRDLAAVPPAMVLTAERARALGFATGQAKVVRLSLADDIPVETLWALADPVRAVDGAQAAAMPEVAPMAAGSGAAMAIELAKICGLLPAAVVAPAPAAAVEDAKGWADANGVLTVDRDAVITYGECAAFALRRVGEAVVPLAEAQQARVVAFRPHDGGTEHLAVIIGDPRPHQAVLTRVHSRCFTGDLLASLRCDCGDQLRGAIARLAAEGGGLLLYLSQEGRGIGLVNKLRAYVLQDQGADTLEANAQLGFAYDERLYLAAGEMLRQLGYKRVRLLTNNPEKVRALGQCGIEVVERVPHTFPANPHNERYLGTKKARAGHIL